MRFRRAFAMILGGSVPFFGGIPQISAQERGAREFPPGAVRQVEDLPVSRLREQIGRLPQGARDRAMAWLGNFHFTEQDLPSLHADPDGAIFYADEHKPAAPVAAEKTSEAIVQKAAVAVAPFPANLVFHSRPGAPNVIYLNFVGETVSGTAWNTLIGRTSIPAVAFSLDNDRATFSDAEQVAIKRIWQRVAEDYAPFNVDVTTERPGTFTTRTAHAVITRRTDANGADNPQPNSGGVAYVGVFGTTSFANYRPAWVYHDNLAGEESYIAEATAHEIGHNLGLSHDGQTNGTEYYGGHGSGETSWGSIMGASYNRNVTQWSKGEYYLANNTQDDLATIAGKLSYRTDDHANTLGAATPLVINAAGNVVVTTPENDPTNLARANKGVIERNTDVDWFSFPSGSGPLNLTIAPWIVPSVGVRGGDIDLSVELYDAAGRLLMTNNASAATGATIQTNLLEGIYYLAIRGAGVGSPQSANPTGYTAYGSIGQYFISGLIIPSGVVIPPGAELAVGDITQSGVTTQQLRVTYTDNVGIDVASIDSSDLRVTGPLGLALPVTLVSIDQNSNGTPRVATYAVAAPVGVWTELDNGVYTVSILGQQVRDTEGEWVVAKELGTFNVTVPRVLYSQRMDTSPGWSFEGLWQFGAPRYAANAGPTAGYTGANIVAYNLSGNYENRLAAAYATTPSINCAGASSLTLRFRRWMRVRNGDTANIQISVDGALWTDVWANNRAVSDSSWQEVQYTLPPIAAGSPTVRLRWGMASGPSQNDIGWNIDDVEIFGNGTFDTTAPIAVLEAPNIVSGGSPLHTFSVTYSDNAGISVASLGDADLYVLGPNGFSNVVQIAGIDLPTDGTPRTATYTLPAPGDAWTSGHNGEYQVYLNADAVADTSNNSFDETLLGRFTVAIPDASEIRVTGINLIAGVLVISASGELGANLILESSTDFSQWSEVDSALAVAGIVEFQLPDLAASARFFRVRRN